MSEVDGLAQALERALGAEFIRYAPQGLDGLDVDGRRPRFLVSPGTPEEVGEVLQVCRRHGAAVIPRGGGTKMAIGNVPRAADVVVSTARFTRLVEHDDANLTATVGAGMSLAELQRRLGERGQFLAVDVPFPDRATVGGTIATGVSGARRLMYGSVRDLVIGIRVVLPSGEAIKGGGKVVKNVAGYDMCKLFVGSLGTLGIVTEATFKMAPLPEEALTMLVWGPGPADAFNLVDALLDSALLPSAVEVLNPAARVALAPEVARVPAGAYAVAMLVEGFREAVVRHARDLERMCARMGLTYSSLQTLGGVLWQRVRDFGYGGDRLMVRVTVPASAAREAFAAAEQIAAGEADGARVLAHAASGVLYAVCAASGDPALRTVQGLREAARRLGGHAVVLSAPAALKTQFDVWGDPPASLALMQTLKAQFDPDGILNPGRFVAGI